MNITFQPQKLFAKIDKDQDGLLNGKDLVQYLRERYVRVTEAEASLIIREYDADFDGNLNFEEF